MHTVYKHTDCTHLLAMILICQNVFSEPNYSVDKVIWFSTEYQIMIFGYKPNMNYLPNSIWLNRIYSTIRLQP